MADEKLDWICRRAGCEMSVSLRGIEAVDAQGRAVGAVSYNGWLGNMVQMHIALDSPIALRALLTVMFEYPFVQQGKEIAIAAIPAHNHRSLRLATHVGFTPISRIRDGYATGDDIVILELRKQDCRWLAQKRKAA